MTLFQSFRDPSGKLFLNETDVWRMVKTSEAGSLDDLLQLKLVREWQSGRKIVPTWFADDDETEAFRGALPDTANLPSGFTLLKHERVEFPSFPYEWSPEMLFDAGQLTLDIAERFYAKTGWSIKDASPFNILYDGPRPVFIDILSFEKRNQKDPIWLAYNQFVQSFLLPLLVNRELGLSLRSTFLTNRDGLPVSEAAKLFGRWKGLKPLVFSLVTLPHLLSGSAERESGLYKPKHLDSAEKAQFVLTQSFRRLRKQLAKVAPAKGTESDWTDYTKFNQDTIPDYMKAKQVFLTDVLNEFKPENVMDVGCNTGLFSFIAAKSGARVVAIDHDEAVVDQVYRSAKKEGLPVLPLVVNLSRPSPRLGWRFSENPSFLDRALGRFDLVTMLAVIHHMMVQERVPLREIMRLASDLTKDGLVVEFVPPDDKMFRRLARGREHLHQDLTPEFFTNTAGEFFHLIRSEILPQSDRRIYFMRKKG